MKESKYSPAANLVFRETFQDENSVMSNGGTPTAVTFSNGVASFNGSSSQIIFKMRFIGTYSIRIILKSYNPVSSKYIMESRFGSPNGVGHIYVNNTVLSSSTGTTYVNGVSSNTLSSSTKEIIITGITLNTINGFYFGSGYNAGYCTCLTELLEIYKGTLTASEVANLYNNSFNMPSINKNALMLFDATQGGLIDRTKLRTLTATDVITKR